MSSEAPWGAYASIYNLGHKVLAELFNDTVVVQEKVDGSQISFSRRLDGSLRVRSKGAEINPDAPDKMFATGVSVIKQLPLTPGWVYRGEYLAKPKHNTLAYARVPTNYIALFDVQIGHEAYLDWARLADEAIRLGLEAVPCLYVGHLAGPERIRELLDRESFLGGPKIEGVVVKNYARFGPDKKALMGKYVSEAFKEVHRIEWRVTNPTSGDILDAIAKALKTEARWAKAVRHLQDAGRLEGSPRDIGLLIREVPEDIERECAELIRDELWKWAWPRLRRTVTHGLAEWYKQRLLEAQFDPASSEAQAPERSAPLSAGSVEPPGGDRVAA